MAIFNSYVSLPEGRTPQNCCWEPLGIIGQIPCAGKFHFLISWVSCCLKIKSNEVRIFASWVFCLFDNTALLSLQKETTQRHSTAKPTNKLLESKLIPMLNLPPLHPMLVKGSVIFASNGRSNKYMKVKAKIEMLHNPSKIQNMTLRNGIYFSLLFNASE